MRWPWGRGHLGPPIPSPPQGRPEPITGRQTLRLRAALHIRLARRVDQCGDLPHRGPRPRRSAIWQKSLPCLKPWERRPSGRPHVPNGGTPVRPGRARHGGKMRASRKAALPPSVGAGTCPVHHSPKRCDAMRRSRLRQDRRRCPLARARCDPPHPSDTKTQDRRTGAALGCAARPLCPASVRPSSATSMTASVRDRSPTPSLRATR